MDFNEVMDRVSLVIEKKLGMKPKDNVIAKYLDISPTNYANLKNRNSIPYKEIVYFSANYKISTNWIFFGQKCSSLVEEEEKYYSLKVIDRINASCGGGAFEDDNIEYSYIKLNKETLEKLGYSNSNGLEAIKVVGDSMYPILKDKELILIDRNKNKYNSNSIFLVNTTNGLFVKRLKINGDKIDLISDNKEYSNLILCVDEVTIVGKVLGVLKSNEHNKDILDKNNIANKEEKTEEIKEDKLKIDFYTAYVKLVNDKYKIFTPKKDMQDGYDSDTDEPLYALEDNQLHAIIMKCDTYDTLYNNKKLDIEHHGCVTVSEKEYDNYMFLFDDFFSFQYERSKLYSLVEEYR